MKLDRVIGLFYLAKPKQDMIVCCYECNKNLINSGLWVYKFMKILYNYNVQLYQYSEDRFEKSF